MLSLARFASMNDEERTKALVELTGPPNGGAARVDRQIREFEQRYEMSSEAMIASGVDTADTSKWRVLLEARGR